MDPVTHTMTGAVMARAGLDRTTPLAAATLMLAANAPDIDIFSLWAGSHASIAFRRGWTHGPLALVLLPFAVAGLVLLWDRMVRRRRDPAKAPANPRWTLLLATIGVVSHPVLDWLNTYGIRVLMPFSGRWFYGDAVFIVDPWLWLALVLALILARRRAPRRFVRAVALVAVAYVVMLIGLSRAGNRVAMAAASEAGIAGVTEILYQPLPAAPFAAELVAVTPAGYHRGTLRWLRSPRVRFDGGVIARGDWSAPAVVSARGVPRVRDFLVWSRYPYARVEPDGAVYFGDARFPEGGLTGGLGGVRVSVEEGRAVPAASDSGQGMAFR